MRTALCAVIAVLSIGGPAGAQLPPQGLVQEAQKRINDFAQSEAERLALLAKGRTIGTLHVDADQAFRRLGEAIRLWKLEKDAGASPLLAEGVLLDCLSRLQGVKMRPLLYERAGLYVDRAPVQGRRRPG